MSPSSLGLSARSYLIAGVSAAVVGAAVVTPASVPALNPAKSAAAAVALSSVTTPLEIAIKNTYNAVEPWVAWGAELTQYVLSFIPGVWWLAPAIDLGYFTIEPLVQSGVYVFADVIGLDFAQIGPDISAGITESVNNAVDYALAWLNSIVPLPPLPPFPPFPGASVPASAASLTASGLLAAPSAKSITTPIEVAIKNTYNAVEPWANYAAELAQYALGIIPGLWWFAPGVPFAYNSIEPLVRSGVYAFADVIGLNFSQIWPDIATGFQTAANNFVDYGLAWLNSLVPFPPLPPIPPLPGASVAASAASLRGPAAVTPVEGSAVAAEAVSTTPATETPAIPANSDNGSTADAAGVEIAGVDTTDVETTSTEAAEVAESSDAPGAEPAVAAIAPVTVTVPEAVEASADAEAPQPARTARRGHSAPASAAAAEDTGAGSSVRAERPGRTSRAHSNAN